MNNLNKLIIINNIIEWKALILIEILILMDLGKKSKKIAHTYD
jgi:hypothetical protein